LAGLKHVRSAPSARVCLRPAIEVQVGLVNNIWWAIRRLSQLSVVKLKSLKLKAEMQEMKKMMQEQVKLIKSLTAK
jgi:hypothetical protein